MRRFYSEVVTKTSLLPTSNSWMACNPSELGSQNDRSGTFMLKPDCGFVPPPHCALISTPLNRLVALNVKSTGWPAFGLVKVAVTGLNVPDVNNGIVTTAFVALSSV